jgi:hypothetical protein
VAIRALPAGSAGLDAQLPRAPSAETAGTPSGSAYPTLRLKVLRFTTGKPALHPDGASPVTSLKRHGLGVWSGPTANNFCACNDEPPPPPAEVATVTVTPATVAVGGTRQFSAFAADADGSVINGVTFTWTSSAPGVATVSGTGLATGVTEGATTITAAAPNGVSGTAALTVEAAPPP